MKKFVPYGVKMRLKPLWKYPNKVQRLIKENIKRILKRFKELFFVFDWLVWIEGERWIKRVYF